MFISIFQTIQDFIFLFLTIIIVTSAIGVILIPNIVYSAFLLGLVLIGIAGIYILLNAEFIAAAQILVYVGAINILILFAIMLVTKQSGSRRDTPSLAQGSQGAVPQKGQGASGASPLGTSGGPFRHLAEGLPILSFFIFSFIIIQTSWLKPAFLEQPKQFLTLGNHLFSDYLLPFEIISVILLVALIGAIGLARKDQAVGSSEAALLEKSTSAKSLAEALSRLE